MTFKKLSIAIILTFVVTIAYQVLAAYMISPEGLQYPNPGHHPGEIGPGTFNSSNNPNPYWSFPAKVGINKSGQPNYALDIAGAIQATGNAILGGLDVTGNTNVGGNLEVSGSLRRAGNTVWDEGNDGSGSGLDSDTVDGYEASDLMAGDGSTGGSACNDCDNDGLVSYLWCFSKDCSNPGTDCDDNHYEIRNSADGTCDGDRDGYIDCSSVDNGCTSNSKINDVYLDCNDTDASITFADDGSCDKDEDGYIDSSAGGGDPDDDNSEVPSESCSACYEWDTESLSCVKLPDGKQDTTDPNTCSGCQGSCSRKVCRDGSCVVENCESGKVCSGGSCSSGSCDSSCDGNEAVKYSCDGNGNCDNEISRTSCGTGCSDSDGDDIYTKGKVTDYKGCSNGQCVVSTYTDYCWSNTVSDYGCSGGSKYYIRKNEPCPSGYSCDKYIDHCAKNVAWSSCDSPASDYCNGDCSSYCSSIGKEVCVKGCDWDGSRKTALTWYTSDCSGSPGFTAGSDELWCTDGGFKCCCCDAP